MAHSNCLAQLAGVTAFNPNTSFPNLSACHKKGSSLSVAKFMGSNVMPWDITDHGKWIKLKEAVRDFCHSLGRAQCMKLTKLTDHDCRSLPFCPLLGERNVACLVGAALDVTLSYKTCLTLAPSSQCTTSQRKLTKQLLKENTATLVKFIDVASKDIFDSHMQMTAVISQNDS